MGFLGIDRLAVVVLSTVSRQPWDIEPSDTAFPFFQPATRRWFDGAFAQPTRVQVEGWRHIAAGEHTLLLAPTGSGKTLAAFLYCVDRLGRLPATAGAGVRVVYVSPLKALAYDIERNLRVPLAGIGRAAEALGQPFRPPRVAVRTGDTPARDRRLLLREPGDILITTPESLYLLLGSAARETLRMVDTVIVDEIHALAPTKRGAHLALSLERLEALTTTAMATARPPQRIGLSATQRPLDEIGRFLAGDRPVALVDAAEPPRIDLTIEVPVDEMENARAEPRDDGSAQGQGIWASIHPRLLELVNAHRSTIIFTNSRRLCERLAESLNTLAGGDAPLVRAHHGSVARAQREEIEESLKAGQVRGLVATSSLELGIDMGAVDLVIQIESPGSVARGLQRVGRAGHSVGQRSRGRIFPKHRADLLESAVVAKRMLAGDVEPIRVPRNPLDVLAQQIVAMVSVEPLTVAQLHAMVGRVYSFRDLGRELLVAVLDMLAGRYPSDAFADLRPRIVWDRATDVLTPRRDARLVAMINGGTIPDRGLYAVHLGADGPRIGELDEEMVYECRAGETFLLGASSWRIVEITRDRVIVRPAPGEPGKMPFWRGEGPGRPVELGRALGAFVREIGAMKESVAVDRLRTTYSLDERAARNLWRYLDAQREATGTLPTDKEITVERFRDELGDWRICILSPFGARVHAPWALALEARLGTAAGFEVQTLWSDDGIVLRFAATEDIPGVEALTPDPEDVQELLLDQLTRSALFASHFRENAARALLLPRRRPGARTPLWAQRLRAQTLMAAAMRHPAFPIVLETYRECLHDVFDLPALLEVLGAIQRRELRVVDVETSSASPFARTLAFAYVAAFMYEGDSPLAERKAQALTLDRNLLRELLGQEELADLLDPVVLDEVDAELQAIEPDRRAHHADALHDLLRRVGDLSLDEMRERCTEDPEPWLGALTASFGAALVRVGGQVRAIAGEDIGRYRDALGVQPPAGTPAAFLEPVADALPSLISRWARTHAPFTVDPLASRLGLLPGQVEPILRALVAGGTLLEGAFRAGESGKQWCDVEVLRILRRRTLARLRNQVAPVDGDVLGRFLIAWHGISAARGATGLRATGTSGANGGSAGANGGGPPRGGTARLREAVAQLEGLFLPFSDLEQMILPARVRDFDGGLLDELGALGDVCWVGGGALGSGDGRIALYRRERVRLLLDPAALPEEAAPLHRALLHALQAQGASFFGQLRTAAPSDTPTEDVLASLWDLVWWGLVTNDTFQPLRALGGPRRPSGRGPGRGERTWAAQAAGRWSTVASLTQGPASDTERAHARALMLLERYGIVSREAVAAEGLRGGFSDFARVLRVMEDAGKIRRGFFVDGLTGAQFAQAGAVDRLRAARGPEEDDDVLTLAAVDPANPYGALLPWPNAGETDGGGNAHGADTPSETPGELPTGARDESAGSARRAAGAKVVLVKGVPVLFLERAGRRLLIFTNDDVTIAAAVAGLRQTASLGRRRPRSMRIEKVNGIPALRSGLAGSLRRAGFRLEPGGLVLDPNDARG